MAGLRHPALRETARRESGSWAVNSLIEEVNRLRRYRNWLPHGRKIKEKPNLMEPKDACDALRAFLTHIQRSE